MIRAEVASSIVIPVSAIYMILAVSMRADLFDPVLADSRRQIPIMDFNPWPIMMPGTMPAVAIVEIVIIRAENDVVGGVYSDIETKP